MSSAALKHDNRFFITISNSAKLRNVQHQYHSEPQSGVAAGTEDPCRRDAPRSSTNPESLIGLIMAYTPATIIIPVHERWQ